VGDFNHGAFVWTAATGMADLNSLVDPSLGWFLAYASSINDSGQITGLGQIGGYAHAFLATPVPEPPAFLLATALFFAIAIVGSPGRLRFLPARRR